MQSQMINGLVIGLMSVLLTACGGGAISTHVSNERIAEYSGKWQSDCINNPNTGVALIDTTYVSGTSYTTYIDEYATSDCSDISQYTTLIEGYLSFGDDVPYASSYCDNAIEVDLTIDAINEDGTELTSQEIKDYFDLPTNTLYDLMCTVNEELYTGDFTFYNGKSYANRPVSINHNNPLFGL